MLSIMDYIARNYDPAIGRFLQPDSIVTKPANPQGFNRYSYVNNQTINLTDPTGHFSCKGLNDYQCRIRHRKLLEANNNENGDDDPGYHAKPWWKWRFGKYHDCELTYKECFYDWGLGILKLSEGQQIDPDQFEDLLRAVYYDLKMKDKGMPLISWWPSRYEYDTPFWNPDYPGYVDPNTQQYVRVPREDVSVCFGQSCYKRSDINFFAQGMWGAISGQTLEGTINTAASFKAIAHHGEALLVNTQYWVTFGYNTVLEYDSINLMDTLQNP